MGKRVDVVLLIQGIVFVVEFKVGSSTYSSDALDQVLDYALDLKNFHEQSHNLPIVPILIATESPEFKNDLTIYEDQVCKPLKANGHNIGELILYANQMVLGKPIDPIKYLLVAGL